MDHSVGFSLLNSVVEAHWRLGSARHPVSLLAGGLGPLNRFHSDMSRITNALKSTERSNALTSGNFCLSQEFMFV